MWRDTPQKSLSAFSRDRPHPKTHARRAPGCREIMTLPDLPSRSKAKSLTAQIRDAEHQVLSRQRRVETRAGTLIQNIHQEMTATSTLLLASGIGFIIGELTKCQTRNFTGTTDDCHLTKTTPLRIALNLLTSVRTLYTALPIAWMIKSFCQPVVSCQAPEFRAARKTRSRHPNTLHHRQAR